MNEVYITRTSSYFPNNVISNDEMETFLGIVGNRASRSRKIVLRNNGIKQRYYALNKQGEPTHSNAEITSLAIRKLFESDPDRLKNIDILSCGTSVPDQMMPSHSVMVHGLLPETEDIEVVSPAGNCCSGMHALKYAYLNLKVAEGKTAVCAGSERLSRTLHADHFDIEASKLQELEENAGLAFEKDFLRWMLSDGAGAFYLENQKNEDGLSLRIDWVEGVSYAHLVETCMYMGSDKMEDGKLKSFMDFDQNQLLEKSIFSMKQDVKILNGNIIKLGFKNLEKLMRTHDLDINELSYFLPHMSSYYFEDKIDSALRENGIIIPKEKWYSNLSSIGNIGAGSIYTMVDDLIQKDLLKPGDKILLTVPESARFSYVFCLLTAC